MLIPKNNGVHSLDQLCHIVISNFKFKIISKIIEDRLATIMPNLVNREQRGFIQSRHIALV